MNDIENIAFPKGMDHRFAPCAECARLRDELEATKRELKDDENWKDTAAQMFRNSEFYHGIVNKIGDLFGEKARISDDGSVQDSVLCLKVPDLVESLLTRLNEANRRLASLEAFVPCPCSEHCETGVNCVLGPVPEDWKPEPIEKEDND